MLIATIPKDTKIKCRRCGTVLFGLAEDVDIHSEDRVDESLKRLGVNAEVIELDRAYNYGYVVNHSALRCKRCNLPLNLEAEIRLFEDESHWR